MKASYFAPLPPALSGVADYAAELLAALQSCGEVLVNQESDGPTLYQLGNNGLHRDLYFRALARPGTVLLHDAVLHHFLLGTFSEQEYLQEFTYNYGEAALPLARQLWAERAHAGSDERYFRYPLLRRVAERSRLVLVHNPAAAAMVRRHAPEVPVQEVPHLFAPPALPGLESIGSLRQQWALPPDAFVFSVFGHLRETKRILTVLRAFHHVAKAHPRAALVLAGRFLSPDLAQAVDALVDHPRIRRVPYLPEADFWRHACAVDCCVNLRWPSAGETSGVAIRLMGLGKAVILSEGLEWARLPAEACLRVDHGPAEEEMLTQFMDLLLREPALAVQLGKSAAAHMADQHDPRAIAASVWELLVHAGQALRVRLAPEP